MYILPKNVLRELPLGCASCGGTCGGKLGGSCMFISGGKMNLAGYGLYAGAIAGGYYVGSKFLGLGTLGKLAGAGLGFFTATMISMRDIFCEAG